MPDAWLPTWDLGSIPDDLWRAENMRRVAQRGHPKMIRLRNCPHCGQPFPARKWREHKGQCPQNPRVQRILEANKGSVQRAVDSVQEKPKP